MHDKLSEAVKLYDKLLTAQVTHPPWRAASTQPTPAPYSPQYQAQSTYGQWSIPAQAAAASPQAQTAQVSYYAGPERQSNGVAAGQSTAYGAPPQQATPLEYAQYNQQSSSYGVASPTSVSIPQYQGYAPPAEAPPAIPAPATVQSPPPSQQQYQTAPQTPVFTSSMQPPATSPPSQTPLVRHNTVSAYHPSQQANPQAQYLSRAKTVSHSPQQLQQLQQAAVPQQLPNFPIVPTAPPQGYQTYTPPTPVEPEREALLIDL
ncbi:uncharacterized protein PHACADRAFT_246548 [Phanerochaete carnosa HHB-10118-sp]|uniref:Uncharacterized protein n=1 Tax=Phanerochaete carnosa (strain HHB-10118-sp) TaxID=650164 RepID=K5VC88_PHACS|nr:uncharacterized protein PHACADRAFT_246548 [Phanerochaete carnosa HHB-10118-sp]EKM60541.1 hypothetical protein PHACADRAFT_246548 [Phanerochaete carnosa HHB-10118-sp]